MICEIEELNIYNFRCGQNFKTVNRGYPYMVNTSWKVQQAVTFFDAWWQAVISWILGAPAISRHQTFTLPSRACWPRPSGVQVVSYLLPPSVTHSDPPSSTHTLTTVTLLEALNTPCSELTSTIKLVLSIHGKGWQPDEECHIDEQGPLIYVQALDETHLPTQNAGVIRPQAIFEMFSFVQDLTASSTFKPLCFKPSNRVKPSSRSQEFKTSQAPQLFQEFKLSEPTVQSFNFKSFPALLFWDELDQRLAKTRAEAKGDMKQVTRAFRHILTEDQDTHGVKAYELDDNTVDTFQEAVDTLIEAGMKDTLGMRDNT
ncbi:hypothetical protein B0H14DRAFT_2570388 [Mycena olivaceomarginata]|nr:hypothetical protein B0H14DRAFT_2570388 [Mycena olivaceomarginata]